MGQKPVIDLSNSADALFQQKVITLTLIPFYWINQNEREYCLKTGLDHLDQQVATYFQQSAQALRHIVTNEDFKRYYRLLAYVYKDGHLYVTLEKVQQRVFIVEDCHLLRSIISQAPRDIIFDADILKQSPFLDDLGPIRLGLDVKEIDYL